MSWAQISKCIISGSKQSVVAWPAQLVHHTGSQYCSLGEYKRVIYSCYWLFPFNVFNLRLFIKCSPVEASLFLLHTLKEDSSSFSSRMSLMVLPTLLMTRSITCTTPFVATWLAWMILAQFTVTTFTVRKNVSRYTEPIWEVEVVLFFFFKYMFRFWENWPHLSSGWCRGPAYWTWKRCWCHSSGLWWGNGGSPCGSEERCAAPCWRCSPGKHAWPKETARVKDLGPVSVAAVLPGDSQGPVEPRRHCWVQT